MEKKMTKRNNYLTKIKITSICGIHNRPRETKKDKNISEKQC